jgi:hypothetical protein
MARHSQKRFHHEKHKGHKVVFGETSVQDFDKGARSCLESFGDLGFAHDSQTS